MAVPTCCATTMPDGDVCGRHADRVAVFEMNPGEQRVPICQGCAMHLTELAQSHGTTLKVERLGER